MTKSFACEINANISCDWSSFQVIKFICWKDLIIEAKKSKYHQLSTRHAIQTDNIAVDLSTFFHLYPPFFNKCNGKRNGPFHRGGK
jgi:hypothetical protein